MSEYQYYEFRAIDRPLTDRQMRELRAISTRAAISRTSFSNHYEYGDLKANPRDLLMNYFDASLYFAHWLYAEVAFRFRTNAVDGRVLRRYATAQSLKIKTAGPLVVVAMSVEREDFDGADDGASWLSSLIGLRGDIASGDERPLYLAWLLGVQYGQVEDETVEPGRPDGLGRLSPDIMGLDRNLVAAAAEGGSRAPAALAARDIDGWLAGLGPDEHVGVALACGSRQWERGRRDHTAVSAVRAITTIQPAVADGQCVAGPRRGVGGGEAAGCPAEGGSGPRTA